LIGFSCRRTAGSQTTYVKPGVIGKQSDETLPDHAGCADNSYAIIFHFLFSILDLL
jgi:hypothetical protein